MKYSASHISVEMGQSALRYFQGFMPEFSFTDLQALLQYCQVRKFPRKAKLVEEGEDSFAVFKRVLAGNPPWRYWKPWNPPNCFPSVLIKWKRLWNIFLREKEWED